jgi:hypothetical protein
VIHYGSHIVSAAVLVIQGEGLRAFDQGVLIELTIEVSTDLFGGANKVWQPLNREGVAVPAARSSAL